MLSRVVKKLTPKAAHTPLANTYYTGTDGLRASLISYEQTGDASKIRCYNDVEIIVENDTNLEIDSELRLGQRGGNFPIDTTVLSLRDGGNIRVTNSDIRTGCYIDVEGEFSIGESYIGPYSWIRALDSIEIHDNCAIGWGVKMLDSNQHNLCVDGEKVPMTGEILLENDVWIGHSTSILKGVAIGQGAAVAANSVVTKDVTQNTLVGGNPAEIIYNNITHD